MSKKVLQVVLATAGAVGAVALIFAFVASTVQAVACWQLDYANKTMTWTCAGDDSQDIVQDWQELNLIRDGWTAKFTTSVNGRLVITEGIVDGVPVSSSLQLKAGQHTVVSSGPNGGFRWTATPVTTTCPPSDGTCWNYTQNTTGEVITMTWTGDNSGKVDIHQGDASSLTAIRGGATAVFTTTVPGVILISTGSINGQPVGSNSELAANPGKYTITSPGDSGGFRWTPQAGFGWRK